MDTLGDLSDDELLARLRRHVNKGNVWLAELITYLNEAEDRRLDRVHACPSMWELCTTKLGMSPSEAQRRIVGARLVRKFPQVLGHIERGEIHLCALYAMRGHLTTEDVDELLGAASGKSTREVEKMIAARYPRPDVPPSIELVAPQAPLQVAAPSAPSGPSGAEPAWSLSLGSSPAAEPRARPRIEPLSAQRYRLELTVSAEMHAKLERIQDLMRHRNPTGDLETIFDASLELLLVKLEKERLGKTSCRRRAEAATTNEAPVLSERAHAATRTSPPDAIGAAAGSEHDVPAQQHAEQGQHAQDGQHKQRAEHGQHEHDVPAQQHAEHGQHAEDGRHEQRAELTQRAPHAVASRSAARARSGYVPREVRRAVFERDGEQCTYLAADGTRCPARGHLELDHVEPRAFGGPGTVDNVRVRCRAHNAFYAEQVFGRAHVERRIHLQRCKYERSTPASFDSVNRALRSLGFREPEVRRALATLEKKPDVLASPVETVLREALRVLT